MSPKYLEHVVWKRHETRAFRSGDIEVAMFSVNLLVQYM